MNEDECKGCAWLSDGAVCTINHGPIADVGSCPIPACARYRREVNPKTVMYSRRREGSNTAALYRATEAGYRRADTDDCCSNCRYSYIQEYSPSGTKILCGMLWAQTHEDRICNHYQREGEE